MPAVIVMAAVAATASIYAAKKQQQAHEYNAAVAEQEAKSATEKAAYDEALQRDKAFKFMSTQKANYAKADVEMSGSPLLTIKETEKYAELDALAIRYGGDLQSSRFMGQASQSRDAGKTAMVMGYLNAAGSAASAYGGSKGK